MIAAWTGAQVRAAETPFLERGEGPALMRRAAQPDEMNMRGIVFVYGQTAVSITVISKAHIQTVLHNKLL